MGIFVGTLGLAKIGTFFLKAVPWAYKYWHTTHKRRQGQLSPGSGVVEVTCTFSAVIWSLSITCRSREEQMFLRGTNVLGRKENFLGTFVPKNVPRRELGCNHSVLTRNKYRVRPILCQGSIAFWHWEFNVYQCQKAIYPPTAQTTSQCGVVWPNPNLGEYLHQNENSKTLNMYTEHIRQN